MAPWDDGFIVWGATSRGRSTREISPRLMLRSAKSPTHISGLADLTWYKSGRQGFGIGVGQPGALSTFAVVEPLTIHWHWVSSSGTGWGMVVTLLPSSLNSVILGSNSLQTNRYLDLLRS